MTAPQPPLARRVIGLFRAATASVTPPWRPAEAPYPRLFTFDAKALSGQTGLVAIWHLGVRPRWIRVAGGDLGLLIQAMQQDVEVRAMDVHGGVFLAWALLPVAEVGAAVASVVSQVAPALQGDVIASGVQPSPAFPLPPGTRSVVPEKS